MADTILNVRFLIQSTGGAGPSYTATGLIYDNSNTYDGNDIAVNDEIFDFDGNQYRITAITTQTATTLDCTVLDVATVGLPPATSNALLFRPTVNYKWAVTTPVQNGVSEFVKNLVQNKTIKDIDALLRKVRVETLTLDATDISLGYKVLAANPDTALGISLGVVGGTSQAYGTDFSIVSNNRLTWLLDLIDVLEAGDKLVVTYSAKS